MHASTINRHSMFGATRQCHNWVDPPRLAAWSSLVVQYIHLESRIKVLIALPLASVLLLLLAHTSAPSQSPFSAVVQTRFETDT